MYHRAVNDIVLMNRFEEKLAAHNLTLRRAHVQTLQINVGRKCNQTCRHCHVDAAPWRTEMMPAEIARRVENGFASIVRRSWTSRVVRRS